MKWFLLLGVSALFRLGESHFLLKLSGKSPIIDSKHQTGKDHSIIVQIPKSEQWQEFFNDSTDILNENWRKNITKIFQEIESSEALISDAYNSFSKWNLMIDEQEFYQVSDMKEKFQIFADVWRRDVLNQIILFQQNKTNEKILLNLLKSYQNSEYTFTNMRLFLDNFKKTTNKIEMLDRFQGPNVLFINRETDKLKILSENYHEKVKIISVDFRMNVSSVQVHKIVKFLETDCIAEAVRCYIENLGVTPPEVTEYLKGIIVSKHPITREFFFISNQEGWVVIIDANSYEKILSYNAPEIAESSNVIINDTLYSIDGSAGVIKTTSLENIMSQNLKDWINIASFPGIEGIYIRNAGVVNGTVIYFVFNDDYGGVIYSYDTVLNLLEKWGDVEASFGYDSITVFNSNVYAFVNNFIFGSDFYSCYECEGCVEISKPADSQRLYSAVFNLENSVCIAGGSGDDEGDHSDVYCYDPATEDWTVNVSYMNKQRSCPGVATSSSGVHIFGGCGPDGYLVDSVERLNVSNQKWIYTENVFNNPDEYYSCCMEAIAFYY